LLCATRSNYQLKNSQSQNSMPQNLYELGAIAFVFILAIREFFSYLKSRKSNGNNVLSQAILTELQSMNTNHLHELKGALEQGNERLVDTIHNGNTKMIELLGEIKGILSK